MHITHPLEIGNCVQKVHKLSNYTRNVGILTLNSFFLNFFISMRTFRVTSIGSYAQLRLPVITFRLNFPDVFLTGMARAVSLVQKERPIRGRKEERRSIIAKQGKASKEKEKYNAKEFPLIVSQPTFIPSWY